MHRNNRATNIAFITYTYRRILFPSIVELGPIESQ